MSNTLMDRNGDDESIVLQRDNFSKGDFTILSDGFTVYLSEQMIGSPPSQEITIPKRVFDYLIKKYQEPQ